MKSIVLKKILLTEKDNAAIDFAFDILGDFAKELSNIDELILCDKFINAMDELRMIIRETEYWEF